MKRRLVLLLLCITCQAYAQPYQNTVRNPYSVSLSFLYWQLKEGGAENWAQIIPPAGTRQSIKIQDAPFQLSPGFRVGVAYQQPHQFWKTIGIFTHYQTHATDQASGQVYSDYLGNFYAGNTSGASFGPYYDQGDIQWHMTYNTLDFQIAHAFKSGNTLALQPFLGLKGAIINQKIKTQWLNPHSPPGVTPPRVYSFTAASEELKNDFSGIGPSIGVNSNWPLLSNKHQQLSLIGNVLGALLLGHWRFNDHYVATQATTPFSSTINSRDYYSAATMASGVLGLEGKQSTENSEIFLKLGYEAQIWFNQIQYYSFNMGRTNNLMSLQGLTLDLSVHFK